MIIDGYAFSRFEGGYRVLNLNAPDKAAVFAADGSVLETTMNDFDKKTVTDEKLRGFSASVQTKCLHAIRDIRIAWRRFRAPGGRTFSRVKVPKSPGSGKA